MHWAFHPALVVALILSVLLDAWGATVHVNVTDLTPLAATPRSLAAFEGMACVSLPKGLVAQHTVLRQDYTFDKVALDLLLALLALQIAV
jgi:hypothetical protein